MSICRRVTRHFIGHVQTNKAKAIASLFDVVQSVDRLEAGLALGKAARALNKELRVLVQVNISPTERFGIAPADAQHLASQLRDAGLLVDGVMAIGPLEGDAGAAFATARDVFAAVGGTTFSLGMSADGNRAITHGSTMIRIGTAIFGSRPATGKGHGMSMFAKIGSWFAIHDEELEETEAPYEAEGVAPKRNVVPLTEAGRRVGTVGRGVRAAQLLRRDRNRRRVTRATGRDRQLARRRPHASAARRRFHVGRRLHDRRAHSKTRRIHLSRRSGRASL